MQPQWAEETLSESVSPDRRAGDCLQKPAVNSSTATEFLSATETNPHTSMLKITKKYIFTIKINFYMIFKDFIHFHDIFRHYYFKPFLIFLKKWW